MFRFTRKPSSGSNSIIWTIKCWLSDGVGMTNIWLSCGAVYATVSPGWDAELHIRFGEPRYARNQRT